MTSVTQVAKNRYTSDRYHDFIGFEISKPVLERAFQDTYGLPLDEVLTKEDLAFGTFRRAISQVIPEMTRVASVRRRKEIVAETPNFHARQFRYYLSRTSYQKEWGEGYGRCRCGDARFGVLPSGSCRKLGRSKHWPSSPDPENGRPLHRQHRSHSAGLQEAPSRTEGGTLDLPDTDFDTGHMTQAGEYALTDQTYAHLVDQLAKQNFQQIAPALRANILAFYSNPDSPIATKKKPKTWQKTQGRISQTSLASRVVGAGEQSDIRVGAA